MPSHRAGPKLALSTRVREHPVTKAMVEVLDNDIVTLAHDLGYAGLCIRPSYLRHASERGETPASLQKRLHGVGLQVSMVTPSLDVVTNSDRAAGSLADIAWQLDIAEALGTNLVRIGMRSITDVPQAQRAADEAAERGIRLAHQIHLRTPFDSVDGALDALDAIARPNFGVIYEPANLALSGAPFSARDLERLLQFIFNVYLQNVRRLATPSGERWTDGGAVDVEHVGIGDAGDVQIGAVLDELRRLGYEGWITVHSPGANKGDGDREAAAAFEFLSEAVHR